MAPFGLGSGEAVMILAVMAAFWALPLIAVVWALVTLKRIRDGQETLLARLQLIERMLGARQ